MFVCVPIHIQPFCSLLSTTEVERQDGSTVNSSAVGWLLSGWLPPRLHDDGSQVGRIQVRRGAIGDL